MTKGGYMGLRENRRQKKKARQAAFKEWDETPKESLYEIGREWVDKRDGKARRIINAVAVTVCLIAIGATIAFGAATSCSTAAEHEDPVAYTTPPTYQDSESTSSKQPAAPHASLIFNIEYWDYLQNPDTINKVQEDLYKALVEAGMPDGDLVYVYNAYDTTADGFAGWVRAADAKAYYQATIKIPEYTVAVIPVAEEEALRATGTAQESVDATSGGEPTAQNSSQSSGSAYYDTRDLTGATALSDSAGISNLLPAAAARSVADTLVSGVGESFGFRADPDLSRIFPNSVKTHGEACSFTVICMQSLDEAPLILDVEYDPATGAFTGTRVER